MRGRRLADAALAGHAPVEHEHLAEGADHDVARGEVAMDDAARVRVGDRLGEPHHDTQRVADRVEAPRRLVQALAAHQPHDVPRASVVEHACVVHGHDPGMLEPGEDAGLATQPRRERGAVHVLGEDLGGHVASQLPVVHAPDHAHAAAPDDLERLVALGQHWHGEGARQAGDGAVGQVAHGASIPRRSRTSSRYSASLPASRRSTLSTCVRKRRRAQARWLSTCVSVSSCSAASDA